MARVTLLLVAGLLWACPLEIEPSEPLVGASCGTDTDCEMGFCLTQQPGGYCSLPCKHEPCPEGARCVTFGFLGITDSICWRSCESHEDCGRPGYACVVPPDQGQRVCSGQQQQ